jgi:hypothetical protein
MMMARTRRRSVTGALAVLAVFLSPAASAASQGAIGPTSRGTITISVSIAAPARTVGLTDFALGPAHQADGATV